MSIVLEELKPTTQLHFLLAGYLETALHYRVISRVTTKTSRLISKIQALVLKVFCTPCRMHQ